MLNTKILRDEQFRRKLKHFSVDFNYQISDKSADMQYLRFSRRWIFKSRSSGLWRRVAMW